jgi:hypothetical protein
MPLKSASAGAVRSNPAEAFAKGGNSGIMAEKKLFVTVFANNTSNRGVCLLSKITSRE